MILMLTICANLKSQPKTQYTYVTKHINTRTEDSMQTDPEFVKKLTLLGMTWGYIKYYHPNVRRDKYDMDAELLKILPQFTQNISYDSATKLLVTWIGELGEIGQIKSQKTNQNIIVSLQPDYGLLADSSSVPPNIIYLLNQIRQNPTTDVTPYYVKATVPTSFTNEKDYGDSLPNTYIRLIALFRYWNMVQYFYPYRNNLSKAWNETLPEFIPIFYHANSISAYTDAVKLLLARIEDMHATLSGGVLNKKNTVYYTFPITAQFIEGKFVVTDVYDTLGYKKIISSGDVIESVDGIELDSLISKNLRYIPAANYTTKLRLLCMQGGRILSSTDTFIQLRVKHLNSSNTYHLKRFPFSPKFKKTDNYLSDTGYTILAGNIGYLCVSKMTNTNIERMKDNIHKTNGLIIDLRGYPKQYLPYALGNWLKCNPTPFVTFSIANVNMPGQFTVGRTNTNGTTDTNCYSGKVVILVDSRTYSQAEYTAMAFQSNPNAVVVGDTTAGSDGDVASIMLPGQLQTYMSSVGIFYPDGTPTHKTGVRIDRYVRPTIESIVTGRDEVLEEAIKIIEHR